MAAVEAAAAAAAAIMVMVDGGHGDGGGHLLDWAFPFFFLALRAAMLMSFQFRLSFAHALKQDCVVGLVVQRRAA